MSNSPPIAACLGTVGYYKARHAPGKCNHTDILIHTRRNMVYYYYNFALGIHDFRLAET